MAPLLDDGKTDVTAFNAQVENQNAAFAAGDYELALRFNTDLQQLVDTLPDDRPGVKGMVAYDRAVILMRKGDTAAGIALLDEAYGRGDLQAVGTANLPVDYYGTVMTTYITALRKAGRPDWREVQDNFVGELFEGEFSQTMLIANWTNVAMVALKDAGHVPEAIALCNRQIAWFEANPQAATPRGFAAVGRPTVFVSDNLEPAFVTGLALRTGRYESNYAFLRADLEDTCGGAAEVAGDLEGAWGHRRASLDWIRRQDETSYFRVIQLRLARLLAFKGDDNLASQYLDLALRGYGFHANGADVSSEVCANLEFVLDGTRRPAAEVAEKFRSLPLTKAVAGGLDCSPSPTTRANGAS
ncbi:hypothetical protein [Parerythrobacter lacustris]|uniref:Tetratricopeptide repeat protein n=1 Tax=Parerythrobacter lacustris TaxID=2969984 RepID=A0ABT1XUI2_9SPHN|nr:hypothetical protein [Parerythrobacter lacustris]MCR2834556.1 hypothetical protein [Parerythrobacter lacustris]